MDLDVAVLRVERRERVALREPVQVHDRGEEPLVDVVLKRHVQLDQRHVRLLEDLLVEHRAGHTVAAPSALLTLCLLVALTRAAAGARGPRRQPLAFLAAEASAVQGGSQTLEAPAGQRGSADGAGAEGRYGRAGGRAPPLPRTGLLATSARENGRGLPPGAAFPPTTPAPRAHSVPRGRERPAQAGEVEGPGDARASRGERGKDGAKTDGRLADHQSVWVLGGPDGQQERGHDVECVPKHGGKGIATGRSAEASGSLLVTRTVRSQHQPMCLGGPAQWTTETRLRTSGGALPSP